MNVVWNNRFIIFVIKVLEDVMSQGEEEGTEIISVNKWWLIKKGHINLLLYVCYAYASFTSDLQNVIDNEK